MAKVTTVTTSYTSNIVVNGTTVSADKIYVNGTQVRRCIVNGTDVIHKSTRTVVTASSKLTLKFTVRFSVAANSASIYQFVGPIYADVTVTDNGSSGFTSITLVTPLLDFLCEFGDSKNDSGESYYQQQLTNQSLPIGQKTTLTFSYFKNKFIASTASSQYMGYQLSFKIQDPDGIETSPHMLGASYNRKSPYQDTNSIHRTINRTLSDNTVQEY